VSFGHNSQVPDSCNLQIVHGEPQGRAWVHNRRLRSLPIKAVGPADNRDMTVANGP
jgi:hypothetical protein